ncbi:iron chaperone [Microbulbifer spongiae]|uniref:DUF1801 domain-containing protein n=1 Tax=Microbulbifer spongiae TaxID=2944933 RepID=A0ABY9EBE2_9GAMM|nr:DUF1801 domain-containing protein [Microbulbifer sp. MI-G]WKD49676.1 DUF1801 domain-containing protein [Microbulbifer sp. MI-G]
MNSTLLEDYLAGALAHHRNGLRLLHDTISAVVPETALVTRRNVPAFRYRGRTLVSIGDARHHVSLYIMQGKTIEKHADVLKAFDTSRTVIRFNPEQIPTAVVTQLVHARKAEIDELEGS